jgi:hypothetical protein
LCHISMASSPLPLFGEYPFSSKRLFNLTHAPNPNTCFMANNGSTVFIAHASIEQPQCFAKRGRSNSMPLKVYMWVAEFSNSITGVGSSALKQYALEVGLHAQATVTMSVSSLPVVSMSNPTANLAVRGAGMRAIRTAVARESVWLFLFYFLCVGAQLGPFTPRGGMGVAL